jgi:uncharacterized protein (TIGR02270 family)
MDANVAPPGSRGEELDDRVLWDVVEEHLDELEFSLEQVDRAHGNPLLTLPELARGAEARLLAHLDGLVIAGPTVVKRLAEPFLAEMDPERPTRVTALVLALIQNGLHDTVTSLLEHEDRRIRLAAATGCGLANNSEFNLQTLARVGRALPVIDVSASLEFLGLRQLAAPPRLDLLKNGTPDIVAAAVLASRSGDKATYLPVMEHLTGHADATVRDRALSLALAWGSRTAWQTCERQALDKHRVFPFSMGVYAQLGGPSEHEKLAQLRALDTHRPHVFRALGLSGNPDMVPTLLEYLEAEKPLEAKLAAQAISAIGGLDLSDDVFALPPEAEPEIESLPPIEEDDLDADLVPPPEAVLPLPDAAAIRLWWKETAPGLQPVRRYIRGRPFTPESLFWALENGPLGYRHALALALAFRSGAQIWLGTRVGSAEQRRALEAARSRLRRFLPNPFSNW